MSLDWSSENCAEPLPQTDDEKAQRNGLIWATLGVDLGSITADNVEEWVFRIWYAHKVGLEFLWLGQKPDPNEVRGWVQRWVGMYTNVITRPRKEWLARVERILVRDTESDIRTRKNQEETANADD